MEYEPPDDRGPSGLQPPSALPAWYLTFVSIVVWPVAFVSVPLAVRAALRGNRLAWWAAAIGVASAVIQVWILLVVF